MMEPREVDVSPPPPDGAYSRRRAAGQAGWMTETDYDQFKAAVEESFARSQFPSHGRLLELGCGAGNMAVWLAGKGYTVWGVDHSVAAIAWANERKAAAGVNVTFVVGDVTNLREFADGFFDIVFDARCLHWLAGTHRARAFSEAHRVLRPGGFFLMSSQCGELKTDQWKADGFSYDPNRRVLVDRQGRVAAYIRSPESIVAEVADAGFRVLHHSVFVAADADVLHVEATKL